MHLTEEEERMLNSDNETVAKCMEILVALGKVFDAEKLVKITSAHISGISYQNIGDEGLEWIESLNARVRVPTTINPAGMDILRWNEMGIEPSFFEKQMRIIKALERIGAEPILSCTPYYLRKPEKNEHIAWAESSAVVYANSILGARTNRESGIGAIAAAITGRTPYYGLHIKENRAPGVILVVRGDLSAAGYQAGKILRDEIPYVIFEDRHKVPEYELKLFGAALAASGGVAMFHAANITPEWKDFERPAEKIEIEGRIERKCEPELVAIGCPHLSEEELKLILDLMKGRKAKRETWLFTSRHVAQKSYDIIYKLEKLGVKVFSDTCMVVSPASERFSCVMVNSGKALEYLPKLRGVDVTFGDLKSCIEVAVSDFR